MLCCFFNFSSHQKYKHSGFRRYRRRPYHYVITTATRVFEIAYSNFKLIMLLSNKPIKINKENLFHPKGKLVIHIVESIKNNYYKIHNLKLLINNTLVKC